MLKDVVTLLLSFVGGLRLGLLLLLFLGCGLRYCLHSLSLDLLLSFNFGLPQRIFQEHVEAVLTSSSMVCAKGRNDKPQT